MKARDLINSNEKVLVIFTCGRNFHVHDDNTGSTGNWTIAQSCLVDRIIIYLRNEEKQSNTVYIANYVSKGKSLKEDRYVIQFAHVQYLGTTDKNWTDFSEGGANPIRYLP
jgi:formylmethanofuran dehydrogenase subunit A